jgi:hypothetical protein
VSGGVVVVEFDRAPERVNGFRGLIHFDEVAPQLQPSRRIVGMAGEKLTGLSNSLK